MPNGFPMILNSMIMYCYTKSHLMLKVDYDTNYEILIEKFKDNTKIILFLFLFYKNQKGFIS
jgi:GH15 family glucan-1,4-alpha-glucosidase